MIKEKKENHKLLTVPVMYYKLSSIHLHYWKTSQSRQLSKDLNSQTDVETFHRVKEIKSI